MTLRWSQSNFCHGLYSDIISFIFQNLNTNKFNSPQHPILGFVKNDADNQKGFAHPYYTHARIPGRSEQKIKLSFTQRIATGAMLFEA